MKLLRVIQDGEIEKIGRTKSIKVNVRVIAATNKNLEEEIANGNFREGRDRSCGRSFYFILQQADG